ncbi:MAG: YigZ family protein [Treponema sp.]|nr:YigZ family protein [Treponema sp.]
MDCLKAPCTFEEVIKGSRFLSELFPCESQSMARDLVKAQKSKYADATHVVHAFVIGSGAEVLGMSDDGEPSGTAGRPCLDVLKGRGCTNTLVTVTRWFGGTLLGTGGLVKAYSGGAKQVIQKADELGLFEELVEKKDFSFEADYSLYKLIKLNMEQFNLYDVKEEFAEAVKVSGKIRADQYDVFAGKLLDLSNGKVRPSTSSGTPVSN